MEEILKILEKNNSISKKDNIAKMLGRPEDEVAGLIEKMEKDKIIAGYKTIVNWDKTDREYVTALIELKVTPQRDRGFEKVAERINNYPEVRDMYLMSGAYDYCVVIEGKTMKQVALFVAEKLAPIENVISTSTHFVLRKYKHNGVVFGHEDEITGDERGNIS